MACVQLFHAESSPTIYFVPFALSPETRGNIAAGPTVTLTVDEFRERGADVIRDELERFYSRGLGEKSELYNLTPKRERERFLKDHKRLTLSHDGKTPTMRIYEDPPGPRHLVNASSDEEIVETVFRLFNI